MTGMKMIVLLLVPKAPMLTAGQIRQLPPDQLHRDFHRPPLICPARLQITQERGVVVTS